MRFVYFLFLLIFAGAVAAFAYENQHDIALRFLDWSWSVNVPVVLGAVYVLGMLSGWTVVGMVRRSVYRITESRDYAGTR
jgi:lipopolysaccharide assembly protein A